MPTYSYSAKDKDGALQYGTVEAVSLQQARERLAQQGLQAEAVYEIEQQSPASSAQEENTSPPPLEGLYEGTEESSPQKTDDAFPPAKDDTAHPSSGIPQSSPHVAGEEKREYAPLLDTLRLYAGWLLAWYALVYAVGSYQHLKDQPLTIPYVRGLFLSPLVLTFSLAAFLFLLLTTLHRALGGGKLAGLLLTVIGVGIFWWYRVNA